MNKFLLLLSAIALFGSMSCTSKGSATPAESQSETEVTQTAEIAVPADAVSVIAAKVAEVDPAVKDKFETLHAQWYEAARSTPEVAMSSNLEARTKLPQYDEMVGMGDAIVPLVVEKLTQDSCFFTQLVYEALRPDDKKQLETKKFDSAQAKAMAYGALWLSNN